jgi:hypothetical protein
MIGWKSHLPPQISRGRRSGRGAKAKNVLR